MKFNKIIRSKATYNYNSKLKRMLHYYIIVVQYTHKVPTNCTFCIYNIVLSFTLSINQFIGLKTIIIIILSILYAI